MGLKLVGENAAPSLPALADIAAQLRIMADHLDAGTHDLGDVRQMVFVTRSGTGEVTINGFGAVPTLDEMIGILTRAVHQLAQHDSRTIVDGA